MKDSLRSLMIAKVLQIGAIAALAGWYLYLLVTWGARCHYVRPYVLVYSVLAIATAVAASTATLLLTRQSFPRVLTSTVIMLFCTAFGCCLGDPLTQGSYDHGGGESEIGWLTGGVIGALVGWAAMTAWGNVRNAPTYESTDKTPSSDAPPPLKPTP